MRDAYEHRRTGRDYDRYAVIDGLICTIIAVTVGWASEFDFHAVLTSRDMLWFIALVGAARVGWHWGRADIQRRWDATTNLRFMHEMGNKSASEVFVDALAIPENDADAHVRDDDADSVAPGLEAVVEYQRAARGFWDQEYALRREALESR